MREFAAATTSTGPTDHIALDCEGKDEIFARLDACRIKYAEVKDLLPGITQVFPSDPHGVPLELYLGVRLPPTSDGDRLSIPIPAPALRKEPGNPHRPALFPAGGMPCRLFQRNCRMRSLILFGVLAFAGTAVSAGAQSPRYNPPRQLDLREQLQVCHRHGDTRSPECRGAIEIARQHQRERERRRARRY